MIHKHHDITLLPTPCYLVDMRLLESNLKILDHVQRASGAKILLAQKGFSMYYSYPLIGKYLNGTAASSLFEARLGREEMKKEVHIFSPAYTDNQFEQIVEICHTIIFNSHQQLERYKKRVGNNQIGLRLNPEYSEIETELYNPCAKHSRFGVTARNLRADKLDGVDGFHFHAMCEQNSPPLGRILNVFEEKFGQYLHKVKWVNFGGGHHITAPDYDIQLLIDIIRKFREKYGVDVYLEPGEAIALNTGYMLTKVLEIVHNDMDIAILDASAACHMPDVLEMPYRPRLLGGGNPGQHEYTYRLGGATCLAGDIIGDYSFKEPLNVGDLLLFYDMAHYSMVKNNTFNGIGLPSIVVYEKGISKDSREFKVIKSFGYEDFKSRL